ncbi:unnamed protein product [Caenorhabditis auriculariae]|uniref:Flavin-containing monooxygenase n=1 Tax=Caenorhabditis auriculariae TaxID=2777116 RepID=A0A8S1HB70_9PELO|nr:unnamed protein product [Caenorhabditis auriculariae]
MQARWAARVFAGSVDLPQKEAMLEDMARKKAIMKRRYFESTKHTIQVDYMDYMDEIASIIGCQPPLKQYLFSDPKFAMRLIMGPNVPYVYRLVGPNAWDGAEQAVREVPYRVKKPLKNRQCRTRKHKKRGTTDEYFRFASQKWIATWLAILFASGFAFYCSAVSAIPSFFYLISLFIFFSLYAFLLLWFDLQYDMSTCI